MIKLRNLKSSSHLLNLVRKSGTALRFFGFFNLVITNFIYLIYLLAGDIVIYAILGLSINTFLNLLLLRFGSYIKKDDLKNLNLTLRNFSNAIKLTLIIFGISLFFLGLPGLLTIFALFFLYRARKLVKTKNEENLSTTKEVYCIKCHENLKLNLEERKGEKDIFCPICKSEFPIKKGEEFMNKISPVKEGLCPHCREDLTFSVGDRVLNNRIICPLCKKDFTIEDSAFVVKDVVLSDINEGGNSVQKDKKEIVLTYEKEKTSLIDSLIIPEPTKSLLWITDEEPSFVESPMTINITVSLGEDGEVESDIKENGFYSEPSLIWTKLPIEKNSNLETAAMYYPRYAAFDAEHRYQYLNWLRDITQPTNLSYVFLYFYGLERHLLIGNYDGAVEEIIRLMKNHKKGSFISYATTSLIVASIARNRMDIIKRAPFILEEEVDEALALRIMLGSPLTGEDVMQMASRVGFTNRRYIKLYPEQFEKILNEKIREFEEEYGPILKVFDINSFKRESRNVFANISIPDEYRVVKVPQIVKNQKFKSAMYKLLQITHDTIKEDLQKKRKHK
jgi:uncharacterized protein YbaR (Trm112 family)